MKAKIPQLRSRTIVEDAHCVFKLIQKMGNTFTSSVVKPDIRKTRRIELHETRHGTRVKVTSYTGTQTFKVLEIKPASILEVFNKFLRPKFNISLH